ncbi:hypothetical protein VNO78_20124 [Psophocarpus tetragonolobus]|uniref:Uncharacterized protein n=1 Tax=Psophocarpus tetragonolobus TaxID=3891 RepID=A0AAN9XGW0_PSOTE
MVRTSAGGVSAFSSGAPANQRRRDLGEGKRARDGDGAGSPGGENTVENRWNGRRNRDEEPLELATRLISAEAPRSDGIWAVETRRRAAGSGGRNAISAAMRSGPISDLRPSLLQIGKRRSKRSPSRRDLGGRCVAKSHWSGQNAAKRARFEARRWSAETRSPPLFPISALHPGGTVPKAAARQGRDQRQTTGRAAGPGGRLSCAVGAYAQIRRSFFHPTRLPGSLSFKNP